MADFSKVKNNDLRTCKYRVKSYNEDIQYIFLKKLKNYLNLLVFNPMIK